MWNKGLKELRKAAGVPAKELAYKVGKDGHSLNLSFDIPIQDVLKGYFDNYLDLILTELVDKVKI